MTLVGLISRFRWRISATLVLVLLESLIDLLLPLFIGIAINGLLDENYDGLIALGVMGGAALVIGSARRFYDTRAYAAIYEVIATELVEDERAKGASTSTVAARTTLLGEFVEFLENSLPEIVTATIGTVGILVIIGGLNLQVLLGCLALLVLIVVIYWGTGRRNFVLNKGYNDELERQVGVIERGERAGVAGHFRMLMRWNRRLSDLETLNYALIWSGVIALLIYAPIVVIEPGETEYGFAFSTILYVFQYIEALVALPLFIQQIIRLQEISGRLSGRDGAERSSTG